MKLEELTLKVALISCDNERHLIMMNGVRTKSQTMKRKCIRCFSRRYCRAQRVKLKVMKLISIISSCTEQLKRVMTV